MLDRPVCVMRTAACGADGEHARIFEFTAPLTTPWAVVKRYAFELSNDLGAYLTEPTTQRFWTAAQVRDAFQQAGFRIKQQWSSYGNQPADSGGWPWVQIVAEPLRRSRSVTV